MLLQTFWQCVSRLAGAIFSLLRQGFSNSSQSNQRKKIYGRGQFTARSD
jgi:hypothetical protein